MGVKRDRGDSLVSWLMVPVAGWLAIASLSLPRQPYSGLLVQAGRVVETIPGGPGARAGLRPGDVLHDPSGTAGDPLGPLAHARPEVPLLLERERNGSRAPVWIVPESLPRGERRGMAGQIFVAAGFVLIASLARSDRRDRLTRAFALVCLAFASLLAPLPRPTPEGFQHLYPALISGVQIVLPALCVHFFALFPEARAPGGFRSRIVRPAYAVSGLLWLASFLEVVPVFPDAGTRARVLEFVGAAAAVWFAAGLVLALGCFVAAFAATRTADARRRLRVALAGTMLGAAPLAIVTLVRNLAPAVVLPWERAAIYGTLLVPAAFAWSIAVHRVFDARVALRGFAVAGAVALLGGGALVAAEWSGGASGGGPGGPAAGTALAILAALSPFAGPIGGRLRGRAVRSIAEEVRPREAEVEPSGLLESACRDLAEALRLDGCAAVGLSAGAVAARARAGATEIPALEAEAWLAVARARQARAVEDLALDDADAQALLGAGVRWVVCGGEHERRVALLLGRRLAGSWLGRSEAAELPRLAHQLAVELDNDALRRAADTHGALDRELQRAGAIQAHLLPRRAPVFPTLEAAAAALSSEPVGGDYYDFIQHSPREFTLAVGDAAGKGVPAALVLAGVQARFRSEARGERAPRQILTALNQELVSLDQPDRFMALLCARVEVRAGRVWIANAGLPPPLVRRRSGEVDEIPGGGVLLGVRDGAAYDDVCVELDAGDTLFIFTDGLTEARRGDEEFGSAELWHSLRRLESRRASAALESLLSDVRQFADRSLDDLTVVVLRQLTGARVPVLAPSPIALKSRVARADPSA